MKKSIFPSGKAQKNDLIEKLQKKGVKSFNNIDKIIGGWNEQSPWDDKISWPESTFVDLG